MILPLSYRRKEDKEQQVRMAVELAVRIQDRKQQVFTLAGILAFTDKVIDRETAGKIRRAIEMTQVAMIFEEEKQEALARIEKEKQLNYRVTDAELPLGIEKNSLTFLYPESAMAELFPGLSETVSIVSMTASGDKGAVYERLQKMLLANSIDTGALHNYYEQDAFQRNLIVIVNVFSYGFIALISLIAAANVFNTISTNISLRRREFAMLESIGMTKKGLYRMLNYECLLYGIKSLLYGMSVALLLTFAIYCVVSEGYAASFYVPAASIIIAVVSVFSVVFATMFYAAGKLRKNSVVETLKNENV